MKYSIISSIVLSLLAGGSNTEAIKIPPNTEFGILSSKPGTSVDNLGLSIGEDSRLLYMGNVHEPFIGYFTEDGHIMMSAKPNTFLTVGGVNKTSLEVHENATENNVFDVDDNNHLTYKGEADWIAVNDGVFFQRNPAGSSFYHFYAPDPTEDFSSSRGNHTVFLSLVWDQSAYGNLQVDSFSDDSEKSESGEDETSEKVSNSTSAAPVLVGSSGKNGHLKQQNGGLSASSSTNDSFIAANANSNSSGNAGNGSIDSQISSGSTILTVASTSAVILLITSLGMMMGVEFFH